MSRSPWPTCSTGGAVHRPHGGRPRLRPRRVAADTGYSSPTARGRLRRRGIGGVIPTRKDQRRGPRFDRAAYRERNAVERLSGRLKEYRAVATRSETLAASYHAVRIVVAILLWL
jgi:transposase